jgi:hypothetical protein
LPGDQIGNEQRLRKEHGYIEHAAVGTPPTTCHLPAAAEGFSFSSTERQRLRQCSFYGTVCEGVRQH